MSSKCNEGQHESCKHRRMLKRFHDLCILFTSSGAHVGTFVRCLMPALSLIIQTDDGFVGPPSAFGRRGPCPFAGNTLPSISSRNQNHMANVNKLESDPDRFDRAYISHPLVVMTEILGSIVHLGPVQFDSYVILVLSSLPV